MSKIKVTDLTISELMEYKESIDMLYKYYDNLAQIYSTDYNKNEFLENKKKTTKYNSVRERIINEIENRIEGVEWE